jgi:hypothetical protein
VIHDSARKAIASITKKVTKKPTSKKKNKDVGTSKRRRKNGTSKEEDEPNNPNDSDFDLADESASASFMVYEEEINHGEVTLLTLLMCSITQSLGGSGPKGNLLLLGMQMLIISLMTHIIYISVPLCKSKLSSVV